MFPFPLPKANPNQEPIRFTKSKRGKDQAIFEGYLYTFSKLSKSKPELKFWVCSNYERGDPRIIVVQLDCIPGLTRW